MGKRLLAIVSLGAALGFGTPTVQADHGNEGHKNEHKNKHSDDNDDQAWQRREGYEYRTYGERDARPPGWSRGKKTGWGDCGLPPGQAKKYDEGRGLPPGQMIEIHGSVDISH